jgi:magnesium chelatase subunit D
MQRRTLLPFTAIVGQEEMKRALLLNAINPRIGGVLIRGEKGTAKSSAVRALAEILPEIEVVKNCPYHCDPRKPAGLCDRCREAEPGTPLETVRCPVPVVTLPLGVTEDRLVGTLDIERAIQEGIKAFEPGILAAVHRGILYIDEVNLLEDHIVDILLDAAAMGMNTVEREGISLSHPSQFILIGTMNPEEGELRPQLLDRFGLQVIIRGLEEVEQRVQIVRVVEEYDQDPRGFRTRYQTAQQTLREKINKAMHLLPAVTISDALVQRIAQICNELEVRTHRAEITIVRTARTIAALEGRDEVTLADVQEAMHLALPHRMRRRPFEDPDLDHRRLDNLLDASGKEETSPSSRDPTSPTHPTKQGTPSSGGKGGKGDSHLSRNGSSQERVHSIGNGIDSSRVLSSGLLAPGKDRYAPGRRVKVTKPLPQGRYRSAGDNQTICREIAFDASIRAAAPHQAPHQAYPRVRIRSQDVRFKRRYGKTATACFFVVDASGSMGAQGRMEGAKGAILSLLEDAYRHRDRIGLIAFRGKRAEVVLPLTHSIDLACKRLRDLPIGGKTPLSHGLWLALQRLVQEKERYPHLTPILILLSDGRANVSMGSEMKKEILSCANALLENRIHTVIIDTESTGGSSLSCSLGYCREIAQASGGIYHQMRDLTPMKIRDIASQEIMKVTV